MRYAEINWTRLPFKGWGGTITAIGLLVLISVGLPEVPKILLPPMLLGAVGGLIYYWWSNR